MQAYRIERFGSVDRIVLRSSEDPRPGLREILMRARASSLNYRDLMVLNWRPRSHKARRDRAVRRYGCRIEQFAVGDGILSLLH
jgi:NADPH:quinone reductase-like Zn-dependent oxidoreductase